MPQGQRGDQRHGRPLILVEHVSDAQRGERQQAERNDLQDDEYRGQRHVRRARQRTEHVVDQRQLRLRSD